MQNKRSLGSSVHHNRSEYNGSSKTILIGGKEIIIRNNSESRDLKKTCHIYNKLNSEKQKLKDMDKEKHLLSSIDSLFNEIDQWLQNEKLYIYLKIEEITTSSSVKKKKYYIKKEEFKKLHQNK